MSRIFLSHSSKDNSSAVALRDWLAGQGWDDVFLDVDPQRGIAAGDRWERALNQAAQRCEAVLFLVSRAWLASDWCLKEFNLAHRLNKRLFGLLIEDIPVGDLPATLTGTWQLVPLASGRDHMMLRAVLPGTHDEVQLTFSQEGLSRLRIGLERAGLDARFFAWPPVDDPARPPYRGLLPLEAADAGIFFGREAPTVEALDRIRGIKDGPAPRLLVLLGASGAGKSSFLRAGLLPRLARDDRNYLPLPVVRPERAAISGEAGLLRSLEAAFAGLGFRKSRAAIREAIEGGATKLRPLLQTLATQAQESLIADDSHAKAPTLVLAIDQGEELFRTEGASESAALIKILHDLMVSEDPALLVLITIRSDSYEQLQTAKALEAIAQQTLSLAPMPRGAYQLVIEGPVARLKDSPRPLLIEPALIEALLSDIEQGGGRDALPLLSFTLERLYLEYGATGRLRLEDYDALGRIRGSIEAAIERSFLTADGDTRIPRDRTARLTLLRRGLIPWLAGVDPDTGSPRRQKARISDIPDEARPLIDLLVQQRLLSTDMSQETGEQTIEPAHEALLRQWGSLQGWLQEDFAALANLETIKRATRDWLANSKSDDWLAHRAGRLEEAERLLDRHDLAQKLDAADRDYLGACRKQALLQFAEAERQKKERENEQARRLADAQALAVANRRASRRAIAGLIVAIVLIMVAIATLVVAEAQRRQALISQSQFLARASRSETSNGNSTLGILLGLAALPGSTSSPTRPIVDDAEFALEYALSAQNERVLIAGHGAGLIDAAYSPDGKRVVTASNDHTARLWRSTDGSPIAVLEGHQGPVLRVRFSPDGTRALTGSMDGTIRVWNAETGELLHVLTAGDRRGLRGRGPVISAGFSPDGKLIAAAFADFEGPGIWDAMSGTLVTALQGQHGSGSSVSFSSDSKLLLSAMTNSVMVWDIVGRKKLAELYGAGDWGLAIFSPDGASVIAATASLTLWDWQKDPGGEHARKLGGHSGEIKTISFRPDGREFVTASVDGTAKTWSVEDPDAPHTYGGKFLRGHRGEVSSAEYSPDGDYILTASSDGTARIWWSYNGDDLLELKSGEGAVLSAHFSPDGRKIVTASIDGKARVYDFESSDRSVSGPILQADNRSARWIKAAFFLPISGDLLTASIDGGLNLWDANGRIKREGRDGQNEITAAAVSPDGRTMAIARRDTLLLRSTEKNTSPRWLERHDAQINAIAFSPDGKRIATASDDKTAHIVDPERYFYMHYRAHVVRSYHPIVLKGHTSFVESIAFSPDGSRILTVANDHSARLWDAVSGDPICAMEDPQSGIERAVFSPDGAAVLTATSSGSLNMWGTTCGAPLLTVRSAGPVTAISFLPDGSEFVAGFKDGKIRAWNVRSGTTGIAIDAHRGPINSLKFSADESRLLSVSEDGTAKIWRTGDGSLVSKVNERSGALQDGSFSPDGARVLTLSSESAQLWDARTGVVIATLANRYYYDRPSVVFADGLRTFATWSRWDQQVRLWSTDSGTELAHFSGHKGRVTSVSFSPDGKKLSTTSADRRTRIWDLSGGEPLFLDGHQGRINSGFFSADGEKFLSASDDGTARIYKVSTGETLRVLRTNRKGIEFANFAPDDSRLVTIAGDGELRLWDPETGASNATLNMGDDVHRAEFSADASRLLVHGDQVHLIDATNGKMLAVVGKSAAFSSDGKAVLGTDSSAQASSILWNAATGERIADLVGGYGAFSEDGSRIATEAIDPQTAKSMVRIWSAKTGRSISSFPAIGPPSNQTNTSVRGREVPDFTFSHDGLRLAAVGDLKAQIVDVNSGVVVSEWHSFSHSLSNIIISPNGSDVLAVSIDGAVLKWRMVRCDAAIQTAKATVTRQLSQRERSEFFLDQRSSIESNSGKLLELLTSLDSRHSVCH